MQERGWWMRLIDFLGVGLITAVIAILLVAVFSILGWDDSFFGWLLIVIISLGAGAALRQLRK